VDGMASAEVSRRRVTAGECEGGAGLQGGAGAQGAEGGGWRAVHPNEHRPQHHPEHVLHVRHYSHDDGAAYAPSTPESAAAAGGRMGSAGGAGSERSQQGPGSMFQVQQGPGSMFQVHEDHDLDWGAGLGEGCGVSLGLLGQGGGLEASSADGELLLTKVGPWWIDPLS
jgi:hypothetical protein